MFDLSESAIDWMVLMSILLYVTLTAFAIAIHLFESRGRGSCFVRIARKFFLRLHNKKSTELFSSTWKYLELVFHYVLCTCLVWNYNAQIFILLFVLSNILFVSILFWYVICPVYFYDGNLYYYKNPFC